MNARNLILGIVIVILLGIAFLTFGGGSAMLAPQPTPTPNLALLELENIVNASGTLVPVQRANLAYHGALPARVLRVAVKPGDIVQAGDVLIQLDAAEEEAAVNAARAMLAQARAGASKEEIAVAQANLDAAKAQLAKVRAGATPEELAIALASLERAAAVLRDAQSQYDRIKDDPQRGMYPQSQALHLATQEYRIAEARYRQLLKGATPEDIRLAEANVTIAQANLERVKAPARPEEIAALQAKLDQASSARALKTLTAPFAGTVAAVNIKEGETVTPGVPLVTLGNLNRLRLETDDLSETNIARIQLGQTATATFDALPGKSFRGKVTYIAPIASAKQGGTNYTVYIEFDSLDPALRWGMTGHIEINTKQ
jgi:HlyD family secretion protein